MQPQAPKTPPTTPTTPPTPPSPLAPLPPPSPPSPPLHPLHSAACGGAFGALGGALSGMLGGTLGGRTLGGTLGALGGALGGGALGGGALSSAVNVPSCPRQTGSVQFLYVIVLYEFLYRMDLGAFIGSVAASDTLCRICDASGPDPRDRTKNKQMQSFYSFYTYWTNTRKDGMNRYVPSSCRTSVHASSGVPQICITACSRRA